MGIGRQWLSLRLELMLLVVVSTSVAAAAEPSRLRILGPVSPSSTKTTSAQTADPEELPPAPRPLPAAEDWDLKPIGGVTLDIAAPAGDFPENVAAPYLEAAGEYTDQPNLEAVGWSYAYYWQASGYCHGPLYFEEVNLERYGYSLGVLQPAVSGAHFFGTLPILPYKMAVDRPGTCIYTLGHARPGSYTPFQIHRPPLRWDAALVEGAAVTGLIFLIP